MHIAGGADHAGHTLMCVIVGRLLSAGHLVTDLGTTDAETAADIPMTQAPSVARCSLAAPMEVPDFVEPVSARRWWPIPWLAVVRVLATMWIPCTKGAEHDDVHVLVLAARGIGVEAVSALAWAFIGARSSPTERHERRLTEGAGAGIPAHRCAWSRRLSVAYRGVALVRPGRSL